MNKNLQVWKIIKSEKITLKKYLLKLKKKRYHNESLDFKYLQCKKNKIKISKGNYFLYKISVKNLGFKKPLN